MDNVEQKEIPPLLIYQIIHHLFLYLTTNAIYHYRLDSLHLNLYIYHYTNNLYHPKKIKVQRPHQKIYLYY